MAGVAEPRPAALQTRQLETASEQLEQRGWVVVPDVFDLGLIARLGPALDHAYAVCREIQVKNGVASDASDTAHHLVAIDDIFIELLEAMSKSPVWDIIERYFGSLFILNAYAGCRNGAGNSVYLNRIHRDIRSFSGELHLMLNTLVMLDDFTEENGATFLCSGSHRSAEKPDEATFYAQAGRALGRKGSMLLFNSNLWHAAGTNTTTSLRRAVTPMFTKAFYKPQADFPRIVGMEREAAFSPRVQQLLGYYARVPASLDEWYQPPERRAYRSDQG